MPICKLWMETLCLVKSWENVRHPFRGLKSWGENNGRWWQETILIFKGRRKTLFNYYWRWASARMLSHAHAIGFVLGCTKLGILAEELSCIKISKWEIFDTFGHLGGEFLKWSRRSVSRKLFKWVRVLGRALCNLQYEAMNISCVLLLILCMNLVGLLPCWALFYGFTRWSDPSDVRWMSINKKLSHPIPT